MKCAFLICKKEKMCNCGFCWEHCWCKDKNKSIDVDDIMDLFGMKK